MLTLKWYVTYVGDVMRLTTTSRRLWATMKVRLRQSLKLSLLSVRFLCHLEKHKFNKHGYIHHSVEMIKLIYQKVYETFLSFKVNHKFTAYTDNLQSQLMPKAYRYFTSDEQLDLGRSSDLLLVLSVHPHEAPSSLRR